MAAGGWWRHCTPTEAPNRIPSGGREWRPRQDRAKPADLQSSISDRFLFKQAILNGPLNIIGIHPNLTFNPGESVALNGEWDWFGRESTNDGVYGLSDMLLRPVGTTHDSYIGSQAHVTFDWQLSSHAHYWSITCTFRRRLFREHDADRKGCKFRDHVNPIPILVVPYSTMEGR
jgi:hypothetical protein